jgi:hypothetical protein
LEREEIVLDNSLRFDDIEALHLRVMVMLGYHVIDFSFEFKHGDYNQLVEDKSKSSHFFDSHIENHS